MTRGFPARLVLLVMALVLVVGGCRVGASDSPALGEVRGMYLGEQPPGLVPQLFAPAVFRDEIHSVPVFSLDGHEVYWRPMNGSRIQYMRQVEGLWTPPATPGFAATNDDSPAFSPDGQRIFFISWRAGGEDIWCVHRTDGGWSSPEALPQVVNSLIIHWQISVASNGDLYFGGKPTEDSDQDIYRAVLVDGEYRAVEKLGSPVSMSGSYEHSPYIAPDGSYLIFSRTDSRLTNSDLYVCFRNSAGSWGPALRFDSPINTAWHDQCASVSLDGRYLFFLSFRGGKSQIYWVDAAVIEAMRPI